jgi:TatD DNase family protein
VLFVDTHCHLDFDAYENDLDDVIKRAVDGGVSRIVVPGLNLTSSCKVVDLAVRYTEVVGAVGIHPSDVDTWQPNQLAEFEALLTHPKIVAVGEVGLDYFHRKDNFDLQKDILGIFLGLALRHNKPVILHSRNCLLDLADIIEKHQPVTGVNKLHAVFHAFEGDLEEAQKLTSLGYYIGVGGPVTYKNAAKKQEVFSKIDLSHMLLETDGPFLAPQAHRGKRNEPAFIPLIAEKIAELRQCDIKEVADATNENAKNLFHWTS